MTRRLKLVPILVAGAFAAGLVAGRFADVVLAAQQAPARFVSMGSDGPFRVWRDTKTERCFIVTSPGYSMLDVGPC